MLHLKREINIIVDLILNIGAYKKKTNCLQKVTTSKQKQKLKQNETKSNEIDLTFTSFFICFVLPSVWNPLKGQFFRPLVCLSKRAQSYFSNNYLSAYFKSLAVRINLSAISWKLSKDKGAVDIMAVFKENIIKKTKNLKRCDR